ncbi:hypothetical protein NDU88_006685 [Pleurodeles waltl]|uniref:Uncharacterized protein n=1 Tax=Pleurodeles waltl TaxID=8319 RepID=A0AAV7QPA1_PLEWA|nr:hypothetical protein NDU88_006685 [Pleurodeles waltl]
MLLRPLSVSVVPFNAQDPEIRVPGVRRRSHVAMGTQDSSDRGARKAPVGGAGSGASGPGGRPQALHISSSFLRVLVPYPHCLGGLPHGGRGPHDLSGWAYYGPTYSRCWSAPGRGSRGVWDTSLVTADYPQRAGPRRQLTSLLAGVPTNSTYNTRSADTERNFHQRVHPARRQTTMQR